MTQCDAWLITTQNEFKFACGIKEFVELQQNPEFTFVPGSPKHCSRLMSWRDHWLPVIKTGLLITPKQAEPEDTQELIGVLRYQPTASAPLEHGGISLHKVPEKITVTEDSACSLSPELQNLGAIVLSCFEYQQHCIPIFDLALLFNLPIDSYKQSVSNPVN